MDRSDSDQNLLVGVMALQLDFVSQDQLVAVTDRWIRHSEHSFVEVLQNQGLLDADECDLLTRLVSRHLKRHGNDPAQSLASIESAKAVQAALSMPGKDWETIGTPAEKEDRYATQAPTPADGSTGATETPQDLPESAADSIQDSASSDFPGSMPGIQRYTVLRSFQRGGLGKVSIASDGELNREVALKEILSKHADSEDSRQRFLLEAEITGSLEHPGVVPVYGLGKYADGRPFYAMRLIRGENMNVAIDAYHHNEGRDDREIQFRNLLGRFDDVCNAIEYAHNRRVLHRDLKPTNIMLGKFGETLVVDWGVAKIIDADEAVADSIELPVSPASASLNTATQMGRVVGTPAYMSPEQALGRLDLLGPAADIYSLGATLYHILTGRAPFTDPEVETVLSHVKQGDFIHPRALKADVPRPLEAICLKAMAHDPASRYRSARDLADDIQRWLADEPVSAYIEPLPARIWRWMKRHRTFVLSTTAAMVVTVVALSLGNILLRAANRRETRLRIQATQNYQEAEHQRQRAEHHFELARNSVRDYYVSVSEDILLNQRGMQPLRDQLLRQALSYYRQFLADGPEEGTLQAELAQANYFVGRITEMVDTAEEAMPYFQQATRLYKKLLSHDSTREEYLYGYGQTLNAIGGILQKLRQFNESANYYQQAETYRRRLVSSSPENVEYTRTLANTVMNLGTLDIMLGRNDHGIARWQEAQSLRRTQRIADEPQQKLQRDIGKGHFNLGLFQQELNDSTAAHHHLVSAVEAFEKLLTITPNDLDSQFRQALCYRALGDMQIEESLADKPAQAYYERALEKLQNLSIRNPDVLEYMAELAGVELNLAKQRLMQNQSDQAATILTQAIETLGRLMQRESDNPRYQRDLAAARRTQAEIHIGAQRYPQARQELEQARQAFEDLIQRYPTNNDYAEQLERTRNVLKSLKDPD